MTKMRWDKARQIGRFSDRAKRAGWVYRGDLLRLRLLGGGRLWAANGTAGAITPLRVRLARCEA
jgi:hypothetical protein